MMPGGVLSTEPATGRFVGARSLAITKTIDYEDGGIAIQDPSQGLLYQRWTARLFDPDETHSRVRLAAPNTAEFTLLEIPNLSEISISFDASMRTALAFVQAGVAKLRWFDTAVNAQVITEIGAGVLTPRVTLDDKRLTGSNGYQSSDVILAYVRDGNLYTRIQRERFTIEHLLAEGVKPLIKIGMNRALRLQFMHEA